MAVTRRLNRYLSPGYGMAIPSFWAPVPGWNAGSIRRQKGEGILPRDKRCKKNTKLRFTNITKKNTISITISLVTNRRFSQFLQSVDYRHCLPCSFISSTGRAVRRSVSFAGFFQSPVSSAVSAGAKVRQDVKREQ
jgi:hypothetical protein